MNGHIPEEKLALLAGGDLEPAETARAQSHLRKCAQCAETVEGYRRLRDSTAAVEADECSPADYRVVRAAVLDRIESRANRPAWLQLETQWIFVTAAVLLAVGLGFLLMRSTPTVRVAETPAPPGVQAREASVSQAEAPRPSIETSGPRSIASETSTPRHAPARRPHPPKPWYELFASDALPSQTAAVVRDDIAIKMETADPNVIIIWLASPGGGER